jgi:putative salt-induced outer membrane protein YdiY
LSFRLFLAALAALLIAPLADADEVVLRNGDRLTGRVISKSGDVLSLDTAYAGVVKINWSAIAALSTDTPVQILVVGERQILRGRLSAVENGLLIEGRPDALPLRDLAYINPRPDESGLGVSYTGHVNIASAHQQGNTQAQRTNTDAEFVGRAKQHRYSVGGRLNNVKEGGRETASNWLGNASFDRFLDGDRFGYVRGSLERDRFKDIDLRATAGGGYGWQLVETPSTNVSVRTGLDYVTVDRMAADDERYPAFGWGLKGLLKITDAGSELFHEHEGFWNLREADRVIIRSRTGLRMPLVRQVNASVQLNLDWEHAPPPGRHSTDSTILLGLTYKW